MSRPKTGGRTAGTPNKATKDLKTILDKLARDGAADVHAKRLHTLTLSEDEHVAVKALTLVLAYRAGKPRETIEIGGADGGPVRVEFVIVDGHA